MQLEILCFILVSSFNICPLILSFIQCDFTVLRRTTYAFCEGSYISQHSYYVKSYWEIGAISQRNYNKECSPRKESLANHFENIWFKCAVFWMTMLNPSWAEDDYIVQCTAGTCLSMSKLWISKQCDSKVMTVFRLPKLRLFR